MLLIWSPKLLFRHSVIFSIFLWCQISFVVFQEKATENPGVYMMGYNKGLFKIKKRQKFQKSIFLFPTQRKPCNKSKWLFFQLHLPLCHSYSQTSYSMREWDQLFHVKFWKGVYRFNLIGLRMDYHWDHPGSMVWQSEAMMNIPAL